MGESVLTEPFARIDGELCCGEAPAAELAERFGTPLYVCDIRRIDDRVRAFRTVGAYGFAMVSNYNGRLRPAETMVDGREATLIRTRETLADLVRGEE